MKLINQKCCVGILLLILFILPTFLILPAIATSPTIYDNYDSDTTTDIVNIYYQSGSAFQYVQEKLSLTDSSLRIVTAAHFYYHNNADTLIQVQAVDESSGVISSSQNITISNSSNIKDQYSYYFVNNSYLITRGSHYIRLLGQSAMPTSIHATNTTSGFSYYSNESTGMGSWALDSNQYLIQFQEENVINLTNSEIKTGNINFLANGDGVDAYLLNLPTEYLKFVLETENANENLDMELYNYTNNGDMVLLNSNVTTSGSNNPEILTYLPPSAGFYVLLIKPNDPYTDASNYTIYWLNSSNQIQVSQPIVNFDNSQMKLDITGVIGSMDGLVYNGTTYSPESVEYIIYRENGDVMVGKNGSLPDPDGDGEWMNLNIDVTGLNPGAHYVRVMFKDHAGTAVGLSPKSNRFFVLGNLSVLAASVDYIGGMPQKINISSIKVYNTTNLDTFTYTVYDNELQASTSITGILNYESATQSWFANNIDVSFLKEGTYFVLGYFEDISENRYGMGNTSISTLDFFVVDHAIEVDQVYCVYTNQWSQVLEVGALAKRSFEGSGIGTPVLENEAVVTAYIFNSMDIYTGISENLIWTGSSWNTSLNVANLPEGNYYTHLQFVNSSQIYNATGHLNSSDFVITHIINITSISQTYVDATTQTVTVEIRANTSYEGSGVGIPIEGDTDAVVLCTIVDTSNSQLTQVTGYATWDDSTSYWKAILSTTSLPEGTYFVMVNFSVFSSSYIASTTGNSTDFIISHVLTLYVPTPIFNSDTATLDIIGIVAVDSYSGYNYINDSTALSTYYELFNYTSKQSLGISGTLSYNSTYSDWRITGIDLSSYSESLCYVYVNISSVDVPEGVVANSSTFEILHKIIITGISLTYTSGFQQTLNITVAKANNTYQLQSPITYHNYRFYFVSNRTVVTTPNLSGNLTWKISRWEALANISKLPAGEYYVVVNFADATAATSKGSASTTNFTVIHSLNVSLPSVSYIDGMNQDLNISCYVNSTYYPHRAFNSSSFGIGTFRIYKNDGTPTSLIGNLNWDGAVWKIQNTDVSLLPTGSYRIKCEFSTSYAQAYSSFSNSFTVSHTITISKPSVSFDNQSRLLNILHLNAESSFSTNGFLNNYTALTHSFEIFRISNVSTGIKGELSWNGTEWQAINYAIPSLGEGSYYIKFYFNDTQSVLCELSSDTFDVKYPKRETDWVVISIILLAGIAAAIILIWTFFTETPEEGSRES